LKTAPRTVLRPMMCTCQRKWLPRAPALVLVLALVLALALVLVQALMLALVLVQALVLVKALALALALVLVQVQVQVLVPILVLVHQVATGCGQAMTCLAWRTLAACWFVPAKRSAIEWPGTRRHSCEIFVPAPPGLVWWAQPRRVKLRSRGGQCSGASDTPLHRHPPPCKAPLAAAQLLGPQQAAPGQSATVCAVVWGPTPPTGST